MTGFRPARELSCGREPLTAVKSPPPASSRTGAVNRQVSRNQSFRWRSGSRGRLGLPVGLLGFVRCRRGGLEGTVLFGLGQDEEQDCSGSKPDRPPPEVWIVQVTDADRPCERAGRRRSRRSLRRGASVEQPSLDQINSGAAAFVAPPAQQAQIAAVHLRSPPVSRQT